MHEDGSYYRKREVAERRQADKSAFECARTIHLDLADRYAARAAALELATIQASVFDKARLLNTSSWKDRTMSSLLTKIENALADADEQRLTDVGIWLCHAREALVRHADQESIWETGAVITMPR